MAFLVDQNIRLDKGSDEKAVTGVRSHTPFKSPCIIA